MTDPVTILVTSYSDYAVDFPMVTPVPNCGSANVFTIEYLIDDSVINSRLQGHPTTHDKLPGVRIASGSLGQGMSVAIGAALTKKLNNDSSSGALGVSESSSDPL